MTTPRTLSEALGGCKELALFEAFALRPRKQLTTTDVENMSGIAWATVHRRLRDWEEIGIVRKTGKVGKAFLFALNEQSPTVHALSKAVRIGRAELLEAEVEAMGSDPKTLVHPNAQRVGVKLPLRAGRWPADVQIHASGMAAP